MAPTPVPRHALLLLPGLSFPLDKHSLRAAYKPTLDQLLTSLTKEIHGLTTLRLDIALILPQAFSTTDPVFRKHVFSTFQPLLGELYTLVCLAASCQQIDLDIPSGLDIRIIFLESPATPPAIQTLKPLSGPLVNLPTLIPTLTPTIQLYSIDSEAGHSISSHFTASYQTIHHSSPTITPLPSGPSVTYPTPSDVSNPLPITHGRAHHSIAVGGTFDHLHIGHKLLLTFTLFLASPTPSTKARKITIGITTDQLLENKKHASVLEEWDVRQARTAEFVESILCFTTPSGLASMKKEEFIDEPGPNGKVVRHIYTPLPSSTSTAQPHEAESSITINYTSISDPFGPTTTDQDISALVISAETRAGGDAVNQKRREKGWAELEVFEVDVLDASPQDSQEETKAKEGFADKISSTEIRRRMVEIEKKVKDGKL